MNQKILIANWKMYLSEDESIKLAEEYKKKFKNVSKVEIVACPSFPYLAQISKIWQKTKIVMGAQNIASKEKGALTGEVSVEMIKDFDCKYVILGHSERRHQLGESDESINMKLNLAYHNNLIPILCVGETLEEKIDGQRESIIARQIRNAINKVDGLPENKLIIAYEPVWAIGTGTVMPAEEMYTVMRILKRNVSSMYSEKFYDDNVSILYGGSVSSLNAKEFWNISDLAGMLIGSASLDSGEFFNIAEQAK